MTDTSWPTPQSLPALDGDDIHVWKGSVGALVEHGAPLHASLDAAEHARAAGFHHEADRARFLLSHGLLRALAAHYLGRRAAALAFEVGEVGKPHMAGSDSGRLAFNLSHSGDLMLLAFARSGRVGVDVERWSERLGDPERARIAASVFSTGEQAALAHLPEAHRRAAFYTVWTRKEAYLKATGAGISRGLKHFEVSVHPEAACLRSDTSLQAGVSDWRIFDLCPGPGYSAALALDITAPRVVTMTIDAAMVSP
ncbi:4'-phosphopantetheinyl transferase superfamily protein [soil metagenome]